MFVQTASCTRAHSLASYMILYDYHQLLITLTGANVIPLSKCSLLKRRDNPDATRIADKWLVRAQN
jgi:hypothetical protein